MSESGFTIAPIELLEPTIDVAIQAGRQIMEIYEAGFDVEQKGDNTPVTEADLAASRLIIDGLAALTPDLPILTEECEKVPFAERRAWRRYWLVDPLDGTREFIKRSGEFTVNIALIDGQESVLGIVYAPALGVYYYGCRGYGAWKRDAMNCAVRIQARPFHGGRVTIAGTRSRRGVALTTFLCNLEDYELLPIGSALKSCLVAEGRADIYPRLGPTSEWDTAAAQCVVEEAGGQITDTHMRPLRYNTKDNLLNPHFFAFGATDEDWSRYLKPCAPCEEQRRGG